MPLTKIDIQYNKETNDLGKCTIEIDDHQVNELLQHFQPLFGEELKQASFSKKNDQTVISFLAPKSKIMRLEKVIHEALEALARLNWKQFI